MPTGFKGALRPRMERWYVYVAAFLTAWAVLVFGFDRIGEVLRQWPTALVMFLGSFVAGSTPMGGGAVSFPFLVLGLHVPAERARDFGLMIQAAGMTSAAVYIHSRRIVTEGRVLVWTIAGALGGMLLGTFLIAPHVSTGFAKLIFACMWMSFAVLTIFKSHEFCRITGMKTIDRWTAMRIGLIVGVIGGIAASIIGVGVEMLLYTVLVLRYRCDVKIAVPTAVSAMAATAVMGAGTHLWLSDISSDVVAKFLAAGPVVIFGAPIGAYVASVVPRIRILYFVSLLGVIQFAWTLYALKGTVMEWTFVLLTLAFAGASFYTMYKRGRA